MFITKEFKKTVTEQTAGDGISMSGEFAGFFSDNAKRD